jgi:hypothetical protein
MSPVPADHNIQDMDLSLAKAVASTFVKWDDQRVCLVRRTQRVAQTMVSRNRCCGGSGNDDNNVCLFVTGSHWLRLVLASRSSYLSVPGTGITSMRHCSWHTL